jgi:rhamnose utilization protein RhaD (predicted bifunctional aldolase and dehydrogenase)
LVDQPDGEAICGEVYDGRMSVVPYVMPGFALAKLADDVYDGKPAVEGLILHKHGIFTFGESAREAYERMIALVTLAEERLRKNRTVFATAQLPRRRSPASGADPADVQPATATASFAAWCSISAPPAIQIS